MKVIMIGFIIAGVIMYAEYLLSTKFKNPLVGGILPLLMAGLTGYLFLTGTLSTSVRNLIPFILMISFLLGDWSTGRDKYKKNKEIELNKMKGQDI